MDIVLFIKALQHKCWKSAGHQVLQPAKDIEVLTCSTNTCFINKNLLWYPEILMVLIFDAS